MQHDVRGRGGVCVAEFATLDFAQEVWRQTQGEGVDVVLNSLRGEFTTRSLGLLRPGGRFLEIGIRDVRSTEPIGEKWGISRRSVYAIIQRKLDKNQ